MKTSLKLLFLVLCLTNDPVRANQADSTTISISAKRSGPTPFINQLTLLVNEPTVLQQIQFSVSPKSGSVTRPVSGTYSEDYLAGRGYIQAGEIFLPVYGLYAGYTNTVNLTFDFLDGSSKKITTPITTPGYDDPCQYGSPIVLQPRSKSKSLSYDFVLVKERCDTYSPTIIDSDGAVRWVGPAGFSDISSQLFDNAIYQASGHSLYRFDFDGTITFLHDYADIGVTYLHHNIDKGKFGLILDADTPDYFESTNIEIDAAGNVLKMWNLADIISGVMSRGGDDPSQFVYSAPADWFHNNSVAYDRADDSIIISSRENFVICLDYETGDIKWILGDPTKKWYQFPSLRQYALAFSEGTIPPIGQHGVSITYDQNVLLFDNGFRSWIQVPLGATRGYSSPRKYQVDANSKIATELWNYPMDEKVFSGLCGSIYEDAPLNYLVDYAYVRDLETSGYDAQLLGLDASGASVFYYQYSNTPSTCERAYNAAPIHLENIRFPAVGPQALNLSTRGVISNADDTLIGGLIITGQPKLVALRALGPSLSNSGVSGAVADPVLTLYDATGKIIAANDDWADDPAAAQLSAKGLAPSNSVEAATQQLLPPAAYTLVARSKNGLAGVGLIEVYDLSPSATSKLANLSTRGFVGTDENVLIGGFVVGEAGNATVVLRALGPSLVSSVENALADPFLTVYDSNGVAIDQNDDWPDNRSMADLKKNNLAPTESAEAATILHPPAGAYSAVVTGANGKTGVALMEIYDLD